MEISEIKSAVSEVVQPLVARINALEAKGKGPGAVADLVGEITRGEPGRVTGVKAVAEGTGLYVGAYVRAKWAQKTQGVDIPTYLRKAGYHDFAKAVEIHQKVLVQGDLAAGGALVPPEFSAELIPLLRNRVVVRKAGARELKVGASFTMKKQTGAGTAYWGNEGTAITESTQATGTVSMQEKKLTGLTTVSNDLMRAPGADADAFVRDDLVNVVGIEEDRAFLRGTGASGAPRGIRNWINSTNLITETISTPAAQTLAEIRKELAKMKRLIKSRNVPFVKPAWFTTAQIVGGLEGMSDGNGNGIFYGMLNAAQPSLNGHPLFDTESIPSTINSGGTADTGGTTSELYLVDMDAVVIGDSMEMEVEIFPNGHAGSRSGIAYDETAVRVIKKTDLIMRHDYAGCVVKNLSWI